MNENCQTIQLLGNFDKDRSRLTSNNGHQFLQFKKKHAAAAGFLDLANHDLRRTYAKLSYQNGARLDQIQIKLGHESLTKTQKYLGIDLDLEDGPGSYLDIEVA